MPRSARARSEAAILRGLDPGIREIVRQLRECGWDTTDSGDGVSKPVVGRTLNAPHVEVAVPRVLLCEGVEKLAKHMREIDGGGWHVYGSYSTRDRVARLLAVKE